MEYNCFIKVPITVRETIVGSKEDIALLASSVLRLLSLCSLCSLLSLLSLCSLCSLLSLLYLLSLSWIRYLAIIWEYFSCAFMCVPAAFAV
jgi:hypothetical protein